MPPKRRGGYRRGGKQCTHHPCQQTVHQVQVTTIISRQYDSNGVDNSLQGAVSLSHVNMCQHRAEEEGHITTPSAPNIPHPLCLALHKGHLQVADFLINSGNDVNLAYGGYWPMFFALENKECTVETVKFIIDKGFPKDGIINKITRETALHMAVNMNHYYIMEYLISISVDVEVKDINGRTPLFIAVENKNPAAIELLVKFGKANINCENNKHLTPLLQAIDGGNYDVQKMLILLGANIHYINSDEQRSMLPLQFAAVGGHLKMTQLLLEHGVDVNKQNPRTGEIALHSVARARQLSNLRNRISISCVTELLISAGSNQKLLQRDGLTPLQLAVKYKNSTVAKLLVVMGSELNNTLFDPPTTTFIDTSSFHLISRMFDKELIERAFEYGANCMLVDGKGLYPFHHALITLIAESISAPRQGNGSNVIYMCTADHMDVLKLFWKQGFPYDLTLKMKCLSYPNPPTPPKIASAVRNQKLLFVGLKLQKQKVVEKALSLGAQVNCCSTEIQYPLHYIASTANAGILKCFLVRGAVVNCLDNNGETPLHLAAKAGSVACCRLLLEYGASYDYISTKCPKTPLQVAKEMAFSEVVMLLESIANYFKCLKRKHLKNLKPEMNIFLAVMNCRRKDGLTLLGLATKYGFKKEAIHLVKLRCHYIS